MKTSILLNIENLELLFNKYNKMCFDGRLPIPRFRVRKVRSNFPWNGKLFYEGRGIRRNFYNPKLFIYQFSKYQEFPVKTLIHEMTHLFLLVKYINESKKEIQIKGGHTEEFYTLFHRALKKSKIKNLTLGYVQVIINHTQT